MKKLHLAILTVAGASMITMTGCASTGTSKTTDGALIGAASGALIGQAIGRNTGSTLAGAAIGNNEEKKTEDITEMNVDIPTTSEVTEDVTINNSLQYFL